MIGYCRSPVNELGGGLWAGLCFGFFAPAHLRRSGQLTPPDRHAILPAAVFGVFAVEKKLCT
jgi:hypothetical protein